MELSWAMELRVLFFTICCLVVCATIYRPVVCATIYVQERLRNDKNSFTQWHGFNRVNCGRRDSLRPSNKAQYLKGVEELSECIEKVSDMEICIKQCKFLRSKCKRLVQDSPPDSFLKESFCAIRRAFELMEDCCSANWILKAVEFGNIYRHFLEIHLDLHRLSILVKRNWLEGVMDELMISDISEETKLKSDDIIREACEHDTAALREKLERESRHDYPDNCLADQLKEALSPTQLKEDLSPTQLKEDPSPTQLKEAPRDIARYITEFDMNSDIIYEDGSGIKVFRVSFCDKKYVIKARLSSDEAEVQDIKLQTEAFYMKKCRHPYAVALLGIWKVTRVPLLLMESMECDLGSYIEGNKRTRGGTGGFPALDAINLVLPVAKVMKHLHEIGVVHRDLKPKNILFTRVRVQRGHPEDVSVKLADFGDARMAEPRLVTKAGTNGYMDPDIFDKKKGVDLVKADVFSFGMVFGEVLTGLSPMKALGCERAKKFYEKLQQGEKVPLPKDIPTFVKSIVESCLKLKPDERPCFDHICWKLQNAEFLLDM